VDTRRRSGVEVEVLDHAVGEPDDEVPLRPGGVTGAGTAHVREAAEEELELDPVLSRFDGEDVGAATPVGVLLLAQEVLGDPSPVDPVQRARHGVLTQEILDLGHVPARQLVDQICSHN